MIIFKLLLIISFLFVPSLAFAWGPLTHTYIGNEILSLGALLPASIYKIIKRHRKDFIYGNLMADIIVGKKYLPDHKNSHNWGFAFNLLASAETRQQKAFVYGYLCHLAADTVAHNTYTANKKNLRHTLLEMKADSIIDKKYWQQAMLIDPKVQLRNDLFLQNSIERFIFSYKTNKRILKGAVFLTICYPEKIGDFLDRNVVTFVPVREQIERFHKESIDRAVDLLRNWEKSEVLKINPCGCMHRKRLLSQGFKTFLFKPLRIPRSYIFGDRKFRIR